MTLYGYDQERFQGNLIDQFDCLICSYVAREPWSCEQCGKIFCKKCINDWITKNPTSKCPSRCNPPRISAITNRALLRVYYYMKIRCSDPKCKKVVSLDSIEQHERICKSIKCWNFQKCEKPQNSAIKHGKPCCSWVCELVDILHSGWGNPKKVYTALDNYLKKGDFGNIREITDSACTRDLAWDPMKKGTGIKLTNGDKRAQLKEQPYVFRTIIANQSFKSGVNYWEIVADPITQNELKIGVACSLDFDFNSAFCDHNIGFAYYGLAQLRHASNASGKTYGKRFKKQGILGVCLDMNKGTLSFALDNQPFGEAFSSEQLKSGPIYPAVAFLHCGACTIRGGMKVPKIFI